MSYHTKLRSDKSCISIGNFFDDFCNFNFEAWKMWFGFVRDFANFVLAPFLKR